MSEEKFLVKNAASEKQVRNAQEKQEFKRDNQLNDLRNVLETPHGRRVIWRILEHCKTFGSIWSNSSQIHYNSGMQDVGHWIMGEIASADEQQLFLMMKEQYKKGEINV